MDKRFGFGENWKNFSQHLDNQRIEAAKQGLEQLILPYNLLGKSFLDIGSGSGLSSLSAHMLGASHIHSFDYDLNSVKTTEALGVKFAPSANWMVEKGDILNSKYFSEIGEFDFVYSWGVLHHTGEMWKAIDNAVTLVKPGGILVIALYNDQKFISKFWHWIKKSYVKSPKILQKTFIAAFLPYFIVRKILSSIKNGSPITNRGMHFYYDVVDWVGGYPFEVSSREETVRYLEKKGFKVHRVISAGSNLGCNQFVFKKEIKG